MHRTILICCLVFFIISIESIAQTTSEATFDQVHAELENAHNQEQEAFISGDCEAMTSFYSEDMTFYANGKALPSIAALKKLCERMPRPFEQLATKRDSIQVLSETAGYLVRVLDFPPQNEESGEQKREVVTKIWSKGAEGWKIVHFQSSISVIKKQ